MSHIPKITRTSIVGLAMLGVAGAGALSVAQQQMPPGQQPDRDRDREAEVTHTAIVVDLSSYLEKQEEHRRGQHGRDGAHAPQDGTPPAPPPREPEQRPEEDEGIDWKAGDYRENLEAGVPVVLLIREDSQWGPTEYRPHVVTFDPNQDRSGESHEKLTEKAGEEVEVSGEIHKRGALRGLRAIHIDRVH